MFPERNTVDAEEIIFDGEVVSNSKQIVNKCNEYFVKSSDEIELCNKQNKQKLDTLSKFESFKKTMSLKHTQSQLVTSEASKLPQYIAAVSVCLGSVAAGTVLGWTANIGLALERGEFNDISTNTEEQGWIGSLATLGALVMCFSTGFFCNLIGRKWTMLMLILPFSLGWLLIIFAQNLQMLYAGRFFTGLAGGAFCVSAPLYTSEISETEIRGRLGSFFQLFLTVGILLAYIFPLFSDIFLHSILCGIIPLIFGVVFIIQPETPVHLIRKGKNEMARASLQKLRGKHYDIEPEITRIITSIEEDRNNKVPILQAMRTTAAKKASLICFSLMFFQQLSGINAVIFYTGDIFEASGIDMDSQHATVIVGAVQVVATFCSSMVVDKLGRKILLLISDGFMAISTILLGVFFTLKDKELVDEDTLGKLGFLPVLALCLFIIVFSLGFGPIPWLISSELFPPEIKAVASSAAATFNWFLAFLVTKFYLDLKEAIGGDITFYIFSGISVLGTLFIFLVVPETKGKSMEEIQELLEGKKSAKSGLDNPAFSN
ncbi:Sugar transporter [Popillia japonica]|uniref:Sugar transporter n=1 Tax=Popillia japonica TaxID=7064 RepID=A0AAW1IX99_POPJA